METIKTNEDMDFNFEEILPRRFSYGRQSYDGVHIGIKGIQLGRRLTEREELVALFSKRGKSAYISVFVDKKIPAIKIQFFGSNDFGNRYTVKKQWDTKNSEYPRCSSSAQPYTREELMGELKHCKGRYYIKKENKQTLTYIFTTVEEEDSLYIV